LLIGERVNNRSNYLTLLQSNSLIFRVCQVPLAVAIDTHLSHALLFPFSTSNCVKAEIGCHTIQPREEIVLFSIWEAVPIQLYKYLLSKLLRLLAIAQDTENHAVYSTAISYEELFEGADITFSERFKKHTIG